ncbi:hypothetical protein HHK36_026219 [Tetracentron sinense]|uniref:Aminotransferase-like plant mobile domain-containing protein n=1 Tax=Tetracentron sinense TaxID=13715 RepID=A0A835D751_TETSI|nr:hypothetical protein HHK36_026219 [Tetracentron sinense]
MDKFSISQIPKHEIVRTCQGARVAITSSEEYPFFSKDESKEQPVLLIREGEHEEECNATRCHYHTAVIGCCAKDWVLDNENPYFLRNWTKMEKHDMIISGYHDPIRKSLRKVLMLQSSHHEQIHSSGVLSTLGHRITNQETNWRGDFPLQGKMFFIPGYWEWAELMLTRNKDILEKSGVYDAILASLFLYNHNADLIRSFCEAWCPITNSIHTPQGEMSLSLWDLKIIGGLPITGEFYDEVVPSLREITGLDEKLTPVLPFSCRFLFLAYHWVRQSNLSSGDTSHHSVSLSSWITWWFRGDLRYHISNSKQTSFKNTKARQQYPSGKFPYRCQTSKEDSVLHDLGVSSRDEDEVLLAAFLSTWLKEDIRETTLKNLVYLWKCSVFRGSSSEFTMPQWKGTDKDIFVSDAFHNWWASNTGEYFKYSLSVLNCMNKMDVVLTAPSRPQSEPALVIIPAVEGSNSTGHGIDDNTSDTHSQNYTANDIKGTRISGSDPLGSSDIVVKTLLSVLSSGSKRSSSEAAEETKVVKNGVGNHSDLDSDRCNFRRQKKNNNDPPVKKKRTSRKKGKATKVALSVVSSRERLPEIRQSSIIPATDPKFTDGLLDEPVLVDIVQSASETSIGDEGQIRRGARQLLERRISAEKVVVAPMPIPLKVDMRHVSTTQLDIGTSEVAPSLPHYHSSIIAQADERSKRGFPTKEITATPSFSIYQKGRIASDVFATAVKSMGHALLTKLKAAPFDRVLRVQDDALDVYSSITHLKGDSAPLKELVDSYAEDVKAYLQQEASLLNGIPLSEWAKLKASTAEKIDVTSSYLALAQQHLTDCSGELEIVMAKRVSLENELRIVQEKESCLRRDVATKEIDVQVAELEVKSAQKACEDMKSVVPVLTAEAENLQDLRKMVEDRRNSIKPSDWMDEIL